MATVAATMPRIHSALGFGVYPGTDLEFLGDPGKEIERAIEEVIAHCQERAQFFVEESPGEDAFDYQHVPFKVARSIRVRYRSVGKLRPSRFILED